MKKGIHPTYYPHAKVHCACGNIFEVGSTKENIGIEICYKCHPFFTGKVKRGSQTGQAQKFRQRMEKKEKLNKALKKKKRA